MAVAVDQASLGTGNASGSTTVSITTTGAVASGAVIALLSGRFFAGATTSSVTGTAGLTWATAHDVTSGNIRVYLFYAFAPSGLASGSTITVTHTNAADSIIGAASYTGVDTSGTIVGFNGAGASTAAWSSSTVTGTAGDGLIGGCFVDTGAVTNSVPSGSATERIDQNVPAQSETLTLVDNLSMSASDSLAGTWKNGSAVDTAGTHVAIAAAFKASGAAAASATARPTFNAIPFMGGH